MIDITQTEFEDLAEFVHNTCGIHLRQEKKTSVSYRLQNELAIHGCQTFSEYLAYVKSESLHGSLTDLLNCITTNHTFFMREADHFDYFQSVILPHLKSTLRDRDLRIWSAGCSSGEEPYTLAILLDQFFGDDKARWDTKVLATDISMKVLQRAVVGEYSDSSVQRLPKWWRTKYLKRVGAGEEYRITESIRNEVIFRRFNLIEDAFVFRKRFHVIFCRNVFIYFDQMTKQSVVHKFMDVLESGGYLFVGHTEPLSHRSLGLRYIAPGIYQKP